MELSVILPVLVGSAAGTALVTALLQHWNDLSVAREERRQNRLAETYLQVVEIAMTASDSVDLIHPLIAPADPPVRPKLPTDSDQRRIRARLSAYGSPAMLKAYGDLVHAYKDFIAAATALDDAKDEAKKNPDSPGLDKRWDKARKELNDIRSSRVHPQLEALLQLANDELAERRGLWARLRDR